MSRAASRIIQIDDFSGLRCRGVVEVTDGRSLSVERRKEDFGRGRVECRKFSLPGVLISRIDTTLKVLRSGVPSELRNLSHHLWKHSFVLASSVKRATFLRPLPAQRKHNVLSLFSSPKVPTIARKRPFGWSISETLTIISTRIIATLVWVTDSVVTTLNSIQNYVSIRILRPPSWGV